MMKQDQSVIEQMTREQTESKPKNKCDKRDEARQPVSLRATAPSYLAGGGGVSFAHRSSSHLSGRAV